MNNNKLIAFDLDGTLISIDSAQCWLDFLVAKQLPTAKCAQTACNTLMASYESGGMNMPAYMQAWLSVTQSLSSTKRSELIEEFVQQVVKPAVYPDGLLCMQRYAEQGYTLVIISASPSCIVAPIATMLFNVEHSIGIDAAVDNNGNINVKQPMSYQAGKVSCIEQQFGDKELVMAYSDSQNDLPLLSAAEQAICINPSAQLASLAKQKHWQILQWQIKPA